MAALLTAMAAGQVSDFGGFARLLAGYHLIPDGLRDATAATFVGAEASAAALLLARRHRGGTVALFAALAWSLLAVQAFARGLTIDNCGCFGVRLGQSLGWWILLEDRVHRLGLLGPQVPGQRRPPPRPGRCARILMLG